MAGGSLLTLLDDIATILDDVAVLSKIAAKKTAGVLGDDLALNAEQVAGVKADRELPVVWAVFKGSLINKLILVPAALLISAFANWLVIPLLMVGGLYLCFEGAEKILHKLLHSKEEDQARHKELLEHLAAPTEEELLILEKDKIKGAVRTDFILSAEIIVIALSTMKSAAMTTQIATLSLVAIGMTIGVYGLVAAIVRMDDAGLFLRAKASSIVRSLGSLLLKSAPLLMRFLAFAGTIAMFLVGGGILVHGVDEVLTGHVHGPVHHVVDEIGKAVGSVPVLGGTLQYLTPSLTSALMGLLAGLVLVGVAHVFAKIKPKQNSQVA